MNAIEQHAREVAAIVYSGRDRASILNELSHRMRCVMETHQTSPTVASPLGDEWTAHPENPPISPAASKADAPCGGTTAGLRSGVCPRSGKTCIGAVIGSPGHYNAGLLIGRTIREALAGKINRTTFTHRLIEIFERPPQDLALHQPND
ncbi:MAG: hypothetical protein JJT96_11645 [Opitutales bacterium]|nr:hypothetical protein [Opitutales bacterium]